MRFSCRLLLSVSIGFHCINSSLSFTTTTTPSTKGKIIENIPPLSTSSSRKYVTDLKSTFDSEIVDDMPSFSSPSQQNNNNGNVAEYTSFQTGSQIRIRIGDLSLSRKAWKKRRRSDSPILIPCVILGTEQKGGIQNNLWYLLQKYGKVLSDGHVGLGMKVKNMVPLYEREFRKSLVNDAYDLGYEGVGDLLLSLYDDDVNSSGSSGKKNNHMNDNNNMVSIVKTDTNLILSTPMLSSIRRARINASHTCILQMVNQQEEEQILTHTGYIKSHHDELLPLSAALRVNNINALSRIREGELVSAYIFQYDETGDNGQPLLVVTLDPPHNRGPSTNMASLSRRNQKTKNNKEPNQHKNNKVTKKMDQINMMESIPIRKILSSHNKKQDLNVGDGPFSGKVISINHRMNSVFVDCGVGRKRGKSRGGGTEKILGMLKLEGAQEVQKHKESSLESEEGEEIEEDITNSFQLNSDGSLFSVDAETGEKQELLANLNDDDVELEYDDDDDDGDDIFAGMDANERLDAIADLLGEAEEKEELLHAKSTTTTPKDISSFKPGDDIEVFVSAIFPQSGRFMISLDKPTQNSQKYKEKKLSNTVSKRLSKLQEKNMDMEKFFGVECDGIVKAVSKTGDWYYVAPHFDVESDGVTLPKVGIATPVSLDFVEDIQEGSKVRVCIQGIDETRGQLSMSLLNLIEE